jgi:hypothetical protein
VQPAASTGASISRTPSQSASSNISSSPQPTNDVRCLPGWLATDTGCIHLSPVTVGNLDGAASVCDAESATLASFTDMTTFIAARSALSGDTCWTGLTTSALYGGNPAGNSPTDWVWTNGDSAAFFRSNSASMWAPGQPSAVTSTASCAMLSGAGLFLVPCASTPTSSKVLCSQPQVNAVCMSGWTHADGRCYALWGGGSVVATNTQDGRAMCQSIGGDLATVSSPLQALTVATLSIVPNLVGIPSLVGLSLNLQAPGCGLPTGTAKCWVWLNGDSNFYVSNIPDMWDSYPPPANPLAGCGGFSGGLLPISCSLQPSIPLCMLGVITGGGGGALVHPSAVSAGVVAGSVVSVLLVVGLAVFAVFLVRSPALRRRLFSKGKYRRALSTRESWHTVKEVQPPVGSASQELPNVQRKSDKRPLTGISKPAEPFTEPQLKGSPVVVKNPMAASTIVHYPASQEGSRRQLIRDAHRMSFQPRQANAVEEAPLPSQVAGAHV